MRLTSALLLASTASAISYPDLSTIANLFSRKDSGCPAVWTSISSELTKKFLSNGQCNPDARAAIREVFHDCGAWNTGLGSTGGCDGSLILAGELSRGENKGLQGISDYLQGLATKYNVTVADMIVFAGSHAIVTCPGGPRIKTYVGRKDSTNPAPNGLLPDVNAPAADLLALFQAKGFDERDLAAILGQANIMPGAHSTSNQFNFNPGRSGDAQDSTPGVWDVKYCKSTLGAAKMHAETLNPPKNVLVLPSDAKLSQYGNVAKEFQGFVNNQGKWNGKFADAMGRMTLFGSSGTNGLSDCTNVLPQATNVKRELRAMSMFKPRN
ncbi:class II peroxidase [Melanomma pulvis-pyrius CBS 109.77]|uniref:Peroxidase n=1 Tax=Melanomma pulvis-pyrius CBS 109.77 TaxID=1314802 RepID=A0A6A6XUR8_9PLEO|nr:class II peroxidase [Melanomma pulvis-pyrius CBS 109.77]